MSDEMTSTEDGLLSDTTGQVCSRQPARVLVIAWHRPSRVGGCPRRTVWTLTDRYAPAASSATSPPSASWARPGPGGRRGDASVCRALVRLARAPVHSPDTPARAPPAYSSFTLLVNMWHLAATPRCVLREVRRRGNHTELPKAVNAEFVDDIPNGIRVRPVLQIAERWYGEPG